MSLKEENHVFFKVVIPKFMKTLKYTYQWGGYIYCPFITNRAAELPQRLNSSLLGSILVALPYLNLCYNLDSEIIGGKLVSLLPNNLAHILLQ